MHFSTLNSAYNEKQCAGILLCYRQLYIKGNITIGEWGIFGVDTILQKSGVIYRFRCGRVDCDEEYIGESGRTFAERLREHMKAPSPIHDHHNITGLMKCLWTTLVHSTLPIMKNNMQGFCFVIGSFSLRAT